MRLCAVDGCGEPHCAKGFCNRHYQESRRDEKSPFRRRPGRKRKSCTVCGSRGHAKGLCSLHYQTLKRNGDPLTYQIGKRGLGGNRNGYRIRFVQGKQVLEHRLVMEKVLGRKLLHHENVHHMNGIRNDNRPENLELWVKCQPKGQRVSDMVSFAIELLKTYSPESLRL